MLSRAHAPSHGAVASLSGTEQLNQFSLWDKCFKFYRDGKAEE
jgi:hypothetical protein